MIKKYVFYDQLTNKLVISNENLKNEVDSYVELLTVNGNSERIIDITVNSFCAGFAVRSNLDENYVVKNDPQEFIEKYF